MSEKTVKTSEIQLLPFFARFLEEETEEGDKKIPTLPFTLKYPSDWEEW